MLISDSTVRAIKSILPHVLEMHGVLTTAPNSSRRQKIYNCPFCGSGTHKNQTSALSWKDENGIVTYFCHSCMTRGQGKDNIHVFANHYGLDPKSDFNEICRRVCDDFAIRFETEQNERNKTHMNSTTEDIKSKLVEEQSRKKIINEVIADAQNHLQDFITNQGGLWRGLTYDTLQHFHCGYKANWSHSKKFAESPRVIVPASTEFDNANYLARLTVPFDTLKANVQNYSKAKEHDGTKTLFNPDALNVNEPVLVTEGYIDAMSIWQATQGSIAIVALGGANQGATLLDALKAKGITGKQFIILFDADMREQGKTLNTDLATELYNCENPAVCKFIYDFLPDEDKDFFGIKVDANQLLQERGGEFLRSIIDKIISDTQEELSAVKNEIVDNAILNEQLDIWQETNGEIESKIIAKIKDAKKFIDALSKDNFTAEIPFDIAVRHKVALCKFYLPNTAQRFFDTLKAAKVNAAEKIKALKKQNPPVDIPCDLQSLADIARSKIEDDIDSLVGTIRKNHKIAIEDKKIDTLNAQRKAERQRIAEANESTAQNVKNCPIDLKIPVDCYFNENGIQLIDYSGKYPKTFKAAQTPIIPTKILREPFKHTTQYEVAVKANGQWRFIIVDGDELADSKKILRLAKDGGALIEDAKALTKFFARIIKANEDRLPEIKSYSQPGWHGDQFIYPTGGDGYIVKRSNVNYAEAFSTSGDKEAWKDKFREIIGTGTQNNLKRIVLGAPLVSPILKIIHMPNFCLHIKGAKNSAKTPLVKFGMSVYGNPAESYLLRTFDSSPKNRVAMAVAFNDLPQAIDELETLSPKEFGELQKSIYDFVSGVDGQKNQKTGDVRDISRFRGVRITTGERPILDQTAKGGAYKRCITLHVSEPLFDIKSARKLHIFCEKHYGHFGRGWIDYISEHSEEIYSDFEQILDSIEDYATEFEASNVRAMAACSLAFWHFRKFIGFDKNFELDMAISDTKLILRLLPTQDDISDVKRGIELLASYVDEHPRNFAQASETTETFNPAISFTEQSGITLPDGRVGIFPNAFRRICEEIHLPSYEKFLDELFDSGLLICKNRREKTKQLWIGNTNKRVYLFKPNTLIISVESDTDANESTERKEIC